MVPLLDILQCVLVIAEYLAYFNCIRSVFFILNSFDLHTESELFTTQGNSSLQPAAGTGSGARECPRPRFANPPPTYIPKLPRRTDSVSQPFHLRTFWLRSCASPAVGIGPAAFVTLACLGAFHVRFISRCRRWTDPLALEPELARAANPVRR